MDPVLRPGHADPGSPSDPCGCCDGIALATPAAVANRPNLPAVAARAGGHARHKASMLAGLSSSTTLPLRGLGTREDEDFSIALIDAWASALEVLGFYQERLANEAFVGTATERFSLGELARLVGYRLHPGAAAETELVFLMDDPPGAVPDVTELTIPAGTRVQSQPGSGETAQIFETTADLAARVGWNRLRPRQTELVLPGTGSRAAWLAGTPQLAKGDLLLFVGAGRQDDPLATDWNVRRVVATAIEADGARTRVEWDMALSDIAAEGLRLFVMRERASLFGHNAPDPKVFSPRQLANFGFSSDGGGVSPADDWSFRLPLLPPLSEPGIFNGSIPLDAIYKSFVADSWIVLSGPVVLAVGVGGALALRVRQSWDDGLTAYAISGKSTSIEPDTPSGVNDFQPFYRATSVWGGSEELAFTERAIETRVDGAEVVLDGLAADLPEGRQIAIRGPRARVRIVAGPLTLTAEDSATRQLEIGAEPVLLAPPQAFFIIGIAILRLRDEDGFEGTATAALGGIAPAPARKDDPPASEIVTLDRVEAVDAAHSRLVFTSALKASYDRAGVVIHANVGPAAHGEGTTEILGAGDPSVPFQKFVLSQAPVTHRLAATPTGVASTLTVRIDGVAWEEVPDLYDRGPDARVFRTVLTNEGQTIVEFADGVSGARPPPGRDNIVAEFSRGIGRAGNLRAGQLTMPLDRPLGLRESFNPGPATGGDDPEAAEDARRNVPIYTLTLGRVVSITDYRDFALGFPGIAKAESRWVWQGETRRVVVTVAGEEGAEVLPGSATFGALLSAFRELGDPLVGIDLLSYGPTTFRLALKVAVDPAYEADAVLATIEARLRSDFAFAARGFAEGVALSEVAASAHAVAGVRAVDIDRLYRESPPQTLKKAHARLVALQGRQGSDGALLPAEILTLADDPLDWLELMP